jgi:hypothetical protein
MYNHRDYQCNFKKPADVRKTILRNPEVCMRRNIAEVAKEEPKPREFSDRGNEKKEIFKNLKQPRTNNLKELREQLENVNRIQSGVIDLSANTQNLANREVNFVGFPKLSLTFLVVDLLQAKLPIKSNHFQKPDEAGRANQRNRASNDPQNGEEN